MRINSIYLATEGEGIHIGNAQVFVRLQGCGIKCKNCDSKDTWDFTGGEKLELDEVFAEVGRQGLDGVIKRVSITGGDPLHKKHIPDVLELIKLLKSKGYYVSLEASGISVHEEIFGLLDFINFDYKTPSTGVKSNVDLIIYLAENYPDRFQVKSVVETEEDFIDLASAYKRVEQGKGNIDFPWCITPSFNLAEKFPEKRFQNILDWNARTGGKFRVIGQQHKWFFGPDKKMV